MAGERLADAPTLAREAAERRTLRTVLAFALPLGCIALLCLPNVGPVFRPFTIPSGSMAPGLPAGSYAITSCATYGYSRYSFDGFELPITGRWPNLVPSRGDIIVHRLPRDHATIYVKRVVGVPGDRIQMIKGRLAINGETVRREPVPRFIVPGPDGKPVPVDSYEEHLPGGSHYPIIELQGDAGPLDNTPEVTVPPGQLFVLGDNRDNSLDSRGSSNFGTVPVDLVVGKVLWHFGPTIPIETRK